MADQPNQQFPALHSRRCASFQCTFCWLSAHSPMLTHLNASLEGAHSIRAFEAEDRCTKHFYEHYDLYTSCWFTEMAVFGWFQFRNNSISAVFNAVAVFMCVIMAKCEYTLYLLTEMVLEHFFSWTLHIEKDVKQLGPNLVFSIKLLLHNQSQS